LKILLAIVGALITPLIISLLLKVSYFSFASGDVESWIAFWGSYVGALIGAATVYLVTNIQVKEQRNIQLNAIKTEHENALQREMKQFHFKNEIEKIEELNDLLEDIIDSVTKCGNDFTKYITFAHILYGGQDEYTEDQEKIFKDDIKKLHFEAYNWFHKLTKMEFKMRRLSAYIEGTSQYVSSISEQLEEFSALIREGYKDKQSFKDYISAPNRPVLGDHLEPLFRIIINLQSDVLETKLLGRISEMKRFSND
jgi:gas vesicle protein